MKKIFYFIPAALYYSLIFLVSSKNYKVPTTIYPFDKLVHMIEFSVLAVFLFFGFSKGLKNTLLAKISVTLLAGALFAVADEIHQRFVPGRDPDILDVLADVGGIIIGIAFYWLISRGVKLKIYTKISR